MNSPSPDPPAENRRSFLATAIALALSGAACLVPAAVAVIAYLNPLRQRGRAGGFVRLATLAVLPEDGTPQRFPVIADRTDAWNRFPSEPIGAVFLRRTRQGVEALQADCPHLGCSILYKQSPEGGRFFCPCHSAGFDLSGQRTDPTSPSPRRMDTLEVEIRNQTEVWVKFEKYRTGTTRKVATA